MTDIVNFGTCHKKVCLCIQGTVGNGGWWVGSC